MLKRGQTRLTPSLLGVVGISLLALVVALVVAGRTRNHPGPFDPNRTFFIGTDNTYPYHYLNSRNQMEGIAADVVNEAARRAGIRLAWRLRQEGPFQALADYRVDLWPLLAKVSIYDYLHFSEPYLRNAYIVLTAGQSLRSMGGAATVHRLALVGYPLVTSFGNQSFPAATILSRPTREAALAALCRGEADAMLTEARTAQNLALRRPPECDGQSLYADGLDLPRTDLGLASTHDPEAEVVCDRLRQELDRMIEDGTMASLLKRWNYFYAGEAETIYQEMKAQRSRQISLALAATLALAALFLLLLLIRMRAAQRNALAANAAKSQFLAQMSHEIRTPLNGIIGLTHMLKESRLEGEQGECVELIAKSGETLLRLVNDVLDLARIERVGLQVSSARFNPERLANDCAGLFQLDASNRGVVLGVTAEKGVPRQLESDDRLLKQVLINLVGNAVKFTSHGSITVSVGFEGYADGGLLRYKVSDTGIGIAAAQLDRIFERFQQADPQISRRFGGSGLGLAICREIVSALGGKIGVRSEPGKGSTFWFAVPVRLLPVETSLTSLAAAVESHDAPIPGVSGNLLLVEDNMVNQRIARRLLEKAGHTVTTACDGESALRAWQSQPFDAIFMDCHLPGIDGYDTTAEIRRLEAGGRRTPIIALTAAAMGSERDHAFASGMDDFLSKPINPDDLTRVLHRWVKRSQATDVAGPSRPA